MSSTHIFVGRERELERLDESLALTLAGQGQLCFLAGEAGAGKTALIQEFTRRAQSAHADLVVASGTCNDLDGKGDPYLPFREVIGMLTGDVEAGLAQGSLNPTSATRLSSMIARSGQVLVDIAPDLINVVIPGSRVLAVAGKAIASRVGWLEKLDRLAKKKKSESSLGEPSMQPDRIYEEYAAFLRRLSETNPIVISIDDLQWMDKASAGLFFHLARRIEDRQIMLIGAYRPDVVSAGRDGERHPLEPIVSEIMRYRGRATIDLSHDTQAEGRAFVEAFLDAETNRLDETFRSALFQHTEGHALFTSELMRSLRERGDVFQDDAGQWMARAGIDWSAIPERVEGIVAERIAKLASSDQQLLKAASVEGDTFTAEVVARVLGEEARQVVGRLSAGLAQEHGLVSGAGVRRVGTQRLSSYTFRHHLVQEYLYGMMDDAERSYIHEDVAQALVALYGEEDKEIIGRLALHYQAAGIANEAFKYSVMAGDRASEVYANADAAGHYAAAASLVDAFEPSRDEAIHLFLHFGRALELSGQNQRALECYEDLEALAVRRNDRALRLASLTARSVLHSIPTTAHNPEAGRRLAAQALELAREMGDASAEARILWSLVLINGYGGHPAEAVPFGEQSLEHSRALGLKEQLAYTLQDLAAPYWMTGETAKARGALAEARQLWKELGNEPMLANTLGGGAQFSLIAGEFEEALASAEESLSISRKIGNLSGVSFGQTVLGMVYLERGEFSQAIARLREAVDRGVGADNALATTGIRAELAWALTCVGAHDEGLPLAEAAEKEARAHYPPALDWTGGILARIRLRQSGETQGSLEMDQAIPIFGEEEVSRLSAFGVPALGLAAIEVALTRGDLDAAFETCDRLIRHLNKIAARHLLADAFQLRGRLMLEQGRMAEARRSFEEARKVAETIGANRVLWSILDDLAGIEADQGEAEAAEALRALARKTIETILDHIDEAYKSSFCSIPAVARLTAGSPSSPTQLA